MSEDINLDVEETDELLEEIDRDLDGPIYCKETSLNPNDLEGELGIDFKPSSDKGIMCRLGLNQLGLDRFKNKLAQAEDDVDKILCEGGIMSLFIKDYSPRKSQIQVTKTALKAIATQGHILIEGPCGFGKTFVYLLAEMIYQNVFKHNKRVVIATDGISLQEQLYYKDLYVLNLVSEELYGRKITYSIIKGRSNYLCLNKVQQILLGGGYIPSKVAEIISIFEGGGMPRKEFADLDFTPEYDTLKEVACIEEGECLGNKCPLLDDCEYMKARNKATISNFVSVNYHLLFSDLKVNGAVLGQYEDLIMDEAHKIEDVYRGFEKESLSSGTAVYINNQLKAIANKDDGIKKIFLDEWNYITLEKAFEMFLADVKEGWFIGSNRGEKIRIVSKGSELWDNEEVFRFVDNSIDSTTRVISDIRESIENSIERVMSFYENAWHAMQSPHAKELTDLYHLMSLISRAESKILMSKALIHNKYKLNEDRVLYLEIDEQGKLSINSMPVDVSIPLHSSVISKKETVIATSATMSVGGNLGYIATKLGFILDKEVNPIYTSIGESPFKLKEQELWYFPLDSQSGVSSNDFEFREYMKKEIVDIINSTEGGALCLFTSYRNMEYAYEFAKKNINSSINIYKQGDEPRGNLISKFTMDRNSVLFATKSFFTGVDIRGDSLRAVIIDKLPFPQVNDPVTLELQKRMGGALFNNILVPTMIIDLKQAVGRGVRTIDDKCIIAILDNRIHSSNYADRVLKSFRYEKTITESLNDLKDFQK